MGDKQTQPAAGDVPALNTHLAEEPLRVSLSTDESEEVGTVTEFVAQGFEVLARIRFSARTVKAPASLLLDEDGEPVFGQAEAAPPSPETVSSILGSAGAKTTDAQGSETQDSETEGSETEEGTEAHVNTGQTVSKSVASPENTEAVLGPSETVAVSQAPEDKSVPDPPLNKAVAGPAQAK